MSDDKNKDNINDEVIDETEDPSLYTWVEEQVDTVIDPEKAELLIAEDEEDARLIYLDIIRDGGLKIDGAKDGNTTLEMLAEKRYDLLLLDIIMPDIDGISVLSRIKKDPEKYGDPIIVMLTNIGGDLAIEKALRIGANGYMLKSEAGPKELVVTIKKYLAGGRHVKLESSLYK